MHLKELFLSQIIIFICSLLGGAEDASPPAENPQIKKFFSMTDSNYETPQTFTIDDAKKWEEFCKKINLTNPPQVDFNKERVCAISAGKLATTGYEVKIHSLQRTKDKLQIRYSLSPPISGEETTVTTTTPMTGVVINDPKRPVEFLDIKPEIEGLVKKLGDDDWETRESATVSLLNIGKTIIPYLLEAIKGKDAEVKMRCRFLLSEIVPQVLIGQLGWFGINMTEVPTSDERVSAHINEGIGIEVVNVIEGQPAEKYGLRTSDIIITANKEGFNTLDDLISKIRTSPAGKRITLGIVRNGAKQDLEIILGTRPKEYQDPKIIQDLWGNWYKKYVGE